MEDNRFHEFWIEQRLKEGRKYPNHAESCNECVHCRLTNCLIYGHKKMDITIKNCRGD